MNRPALALCLLVLAVGGCGGDDDEPSGNAPTRAEYIAAGDEICTQVNEKTAELNREVDEIERTATDQAAALAAAAPLLAEAYDYQRDQLAEFRDLTPPAGDEEAVDRIVAGIEQQVALVGKIADAASAGDAERLAELGSQVAPLRTRVRGLLQGYGFEECGRR